MPSAPLQPGPIPNPTLDPGYSDPEIDALFWFWDEVASPFFSSVEMYDIYRISNKGGWKAARYALPTGVIEASVAGLRQGYFDSWTQTLSPIERSGRIFVVFSETLATDAAANLAGDAGAIIGGPLGPIGAAAGYGTAAALVTHAADRFWAQAINPQFVPRAGLGIWP
jgi:hypothetical protein